MTLFSQPVPEFFFEIAAVLFGACIGSFLNVCIHRLPLKMSLVTPPSRCGHCGRYIKWYDNIPVLSYIFLGARCRNCRVPISPVYPFVEALTAFLAYALYKKFGLTLELFIFVVFTCALIVVTFIDLKLRIIPDRITLPGIVFCFAASVAMYYPEVFQPLLWSFTGLVAGGGFLLAIALAYHLLTGQEGMGFGDVKLLAMIGTLLWPKGVIFTIFAASFMGAIIGSIGIIAFGKSGRFRIPFGPFISAAALLYVFYGETIIGWYFDKLWLN